ncbi:S-adenosylmethionine uptake transporter [Sphingomonas naasensis]|uniref:DMT family transporter n=1 Tax=Sphingomonas naasensis TaxID=1344951 RepID=A0A4S1WAZ4_9SPHN|nr:DMT family transporter [Sphingomonas naasensis]NIJ19755.1 S-adenosylmethionine uptake transporter [Sphingomonas naasensis]TGX40104.1 DMT family transporter [Sphingomonas naasensis]
MNRPGSQVAAAFAAACAGIALYAVMDAVMKGLVLAIGAFAALFWRLVAGTLLSGVLYGFSRPKWPPLATIRVHFARSAVVAVMAIAFFWGIGRVPLAEAIALSFIAPLIALALAAIFLKEQIGMRSVLASLLGLVGVGVILAGRLGATQSDDALLGMAAILLSAVFYAINLVIARHQAQIAKPLEIAAFQNVFVLAIFCVPAPLLLRLPEAQHLPAIAAAAGLAIVSLLLLSWAYARAEAQILLTVEYTAFIWASLMGWWVFGEKLTLATVAGTVLIVAGCLLVARRQHSGAAPEAEAALP